MMPLLWVLVGLLALVLFVQFGFAVQRDVPTFMQMKQATTVRSLGGIAALLILAIAAVAIAAAVMGA